jgi:hypothetical protein
MKRSGNAQSIGATLSTLAVFLHSGPSGQRQSLPDDVEWIDITAKPLSGGAEDHPVGIETLLQAGVKLLTSDGVALRKRLDDLWQRRGRLILCDDDHTLALAVVYR